MKRSWPHWQRKESLNEFGAWIKQGWRIELDPWIKLATWRIEFSTGPWLVWRSWFVWRWKQQRSDKPAKRRVFLWRKQSSESTYWWFFRRRNWRQLKWRQLKRWSQFFATMKVAPICIPLSPCGGFMKDDTELRYALRSLEKHFLSEFEITIIGPRVPEWLQGVRHIQENGLKSSLLAAANAYPDGFFWWYDDCCLLKDITGDQAMVTPANEAWPSANSDWTRDLETIRQRLKDQGIKPYDYSRPHGPYWFDKSMVDEGFEDWPGMKRKFPWETWILSKRNWPRKHGIVRQYYGQFNGPPSSCHFYLNYGDGGNTPELRLFLEKTFDVPSRFEMPPKPDYTTWCKALDRRHYRLAPCVSVVVTVKGRAAAWARHARSWLSHPMVGDCVIVDWSDPDRLAENKDIKELIREFPFVRIIRVEGEHGFHISRAMNVGLRAAFLPLVAKVDADVALVNHLWFSNAVRSVMKDDRLYYHGKAKGLPGTVLVSRERMLRLDGYREDFDGYGWDDSWMYSRLNSIGGEMHYFADGVLFHEPHDDRARVENYENPNKRASWECNKGLAKRGPLHPQCAYRVEKSNGVETVIRNPMIRWCGPLLPLDTWAGVFAPYEGMTVNPPTIGNGNVGDKLIHQAICQLYRHYGLKIVAKNWDVLMWPGGGNMGSLYKSNFENRKKHMEEATKMGIPIVILPQSWTTDDPHVPEHATVWARERITMPPNASFMHDLALAWSGPVTIMPRVVSRDAWFMRKDAEMTEDQRGADPAMLCHSPRMYLELSSGWSRIHTNRLHFAICCLLTGTPVTLHAGSYGKQKGIWEASLKSLGCQFEE